jgi:hypothetical protein
MSDQIKVNIDFSESDSEKFPVYCQYPGQYQPQPAYIKVDIRSGRVWPDYNGNIGGGRSSDEHHGLIQRFSIPAQLHRSEIAELLEDNLSFFQKVLDSYCEEWNGSNYVAHRRTGVVDDIDQYLDCEWETQILRDIIPSGIIDVMADLKDDPPTCNIEESIRDWFARDGECGWFEQESDDELVEHIASHLEVEDCEGNQELAKWLIEKQIA